MLRRSQLGGGPEINVNFRLITATNCDLVSAMQTNTFRSDLYFRIAVLQTSLPSLAERSSDIPMLLTALISRIRREDSRLGTPTFDTGALSELKAYAWPGNVRELRNVVERAVALYPGRVISRRDVRDMLLPGVSFADTPARPADCAPTQRDAVAPHEGSLEHRIQTEDQIDLRSHLQEIEIAAIKAALRKHDGLVLRAAAALGLSRTTLIEKMRKFCIQRPTEA